MFGKIKSCLSEKLNLAKYELIHLLVCFSSVLLAGFVFSLILFMILAFLSVALAFLISDYYKNYALGFGIIGLFYLGIGIVFFALRAYWLDGFLKNFLTRMAFNKINTDKE